MGGQGHGDPGEASATAQVLLLPASLAAVSQHVLSCTFVQSTLLVLQPINQCCLFNGKSFERCLSPTNGIPKCRVVPPPVGEWEPVMGNCTARAEGGCVCDSGNIGWLAGYCLEQLTLCRPTVSTKASKFYSVPCIQRPVNHHGQKRLPADALLSSPEEALVRRSRNPSSHPPRFTRCRSNSPDFLWLLLEKHAPPPVASLGPGSESCLPLGYDVMGNEGVSRTVLSFE